MKHNRIAAITMGLTLAIVSAGALSGRAPASPAKPAKKDSAHPSRTPVHLTGIIQIPGNPLTSSDIVWLDATTKRFYFSERANFAVDVVDVDKGVFLGRVTGFAGANAQTPPPPNGQGPNGVFVAGKQLWAGDGNSTLRVADVDPASPNYLKIVHSIDTSLPECDAPGSHHCDRVDEIGYDPADRITLASNNQPNSPVAPFGRVDPYATFVDAKTFQVLGHVAFPGATGIEQPLWIPALRRFFLTVVGYNNGGGSNHGFGEIAVINPKTMMVEKNYAPGDCRTSGEVLGPDNRLLVSCGRPVILNALTGEVENRIMQIGGGDEVWYNPGDDLFYVVAGDTSKPPVPSLGLIDAKTGMWLQNVANPGGRQAAGLPSNNHIFTPVLVTAAQVANPDSDRTACAQFGVQGHGCIAVFAHEDAHQDAH
jgi:hypothetical protein